MVLLPLIVLDDLHARIMAIADVFDAISADRCYRKALPLEQCIDTITSGAD